MGVFIYILCFLVAVLSFVCIYAMRKEKQKWFWLILLDGYIALRYNSDRSNFDISQ